MNKKKIPSDERHPIDDRFDFSDSYSTTECTGLITVPPADEDELENYYDIYDFGPYSKK